MTHARRRQMNRLLVVVATPGVLLGSVTLASAAAMGAFSQHVRPAATSCRPPVEHVDLSSFEVDVLNGSGIPGQARSAARQLAKAGFRIGSVTTAADARWTDAQAVISHGPDGLGPARRLAAYLPGAVQVSTQSPGRDIEVVLGTAFTEPTSTPNLGQAVCEL